MIGRLPDVPEMDPKIAVAIGAQLRLRVAAAGDQRRIRHAPPQETAQQVTQIRPQTVGGRRCSGLPEGTADQEHLVARAVATVGLQDDLAVPTGGAHGTRQQMQEPA
jgi:hypothetical protein